MAEVPEGHFERYCALDAAGRQRVREALFAGGAGAIIAASTMPCLDEPEWRTIDAAGFQVFLRGATPTGASLVH